MAQGIVYLVGAGPGDSMLLTLKGLECIIMADVILYDRLVNDALLSYARPDAEKIYVGKERGKKATSQSEINGTMFSKVGEGKTVVRLKGGDPFIFARGGEEADFLAKNGISFEIVSGVTSAIACPTYAGIPLTHRDYSHEVVFITSHDEIVSKSSFHVPPGKKTLVFLMGARNINKITNSLITSGWKKNTPVAVITWGTLPDQCTQVGTLEDIGDKIKPVNIESPAVIVVGKVVNLREKLDWYERKSLFGKKMLILRAREQLEEFSLLLKQRGAEVTEFPTIEIKPPEDFKGLDESLEEIGDFDWMIFTSVNGVEAFFNRMRDTGRDIRSLRKLKFCAIGPKTAESIATYMINPDFIPSNFTTDNIIEGLKKFRLKGKKMLIPRADNVGDKLIKRLKEQGAEVVEVAAYRVCLPDYPKEYIEKVFKGKGLDLIAFTSSSTVRNLIQILKDCDLKSVFGKAKIASIGPVTENTAKEFGIVTDIKSNEYTIHGMVNAIEENFKRK